MSHINAYKQEFRELVTGNFGQLRAEMELLRTEQRAATERLGIELRAEMKELGAQLRAEFQAGLANQRAELTILIMQSEQRTIRWVIGLWLAGIPAMAAVIAGLKQLGWL